MAEEEKIEDNSIEEEKVDEEPEGEPPANEEEEENAPIEYTKKLGVDEEKTSTASTKRRKLDSFSTASVVSAIPQSRFLFGDGTCIWQNLLKSESIHDDATSYKVTFEQVCLRKVCLLRFFITRSFHS